MKSSVRLCRSTWGFNILSAARSREIRRDAVRGIKLLNARRRQNQTLKKNQSFQSRARPKRTIRRTAPVAMRTMRMSGIKLVSSSNAGR